MTAFYREAFGVEFRILNLGPLEVQFGEVGGITLKLVPLRDGVEFEQYPMCQLGFTVDDVELVSILAERHGGRREGTPVRDGDMIHAAVRDPDGNTIELYAMF